MDQEAARPTIFCFQSIIVADREVPSNDKWMVLAKQFHGSFESMDTTFGGLKLSFSKLLSWPALDSSQQSMIPEPAEVLTQMRQLH